MTNLFATVNTEETTGRRELSGTYQLTAEAKKFASNILETVGADSERWRQMVLESMHKAAVMDTIIESIITIEEHHISFLKELDEDTVIGMLKSQQSKRSRAKGKTMTRENYHSMLTAAIAEHMIRAALGKAKGYSGERGRSRASIIFTAEELLRLSADQDDLRRELRNIQSKKSIMKGKENYEATDRWAELLQAEEQLKAIRIEGAATPRSKKLSAPDPRIEELLRIFEESGVTDDTELSKWTKAQLVALLEATRLVLSAPAPSAIEVVEIDADDPDEVYDADGYVVDLEEVFDRQ